MLDLKLESNMCLLSIIIPVYNVENYIERCVLSITQQEFKGYEIILVNDGSTDSSLKICRDLADKFSNIIIVDKENGGASSARNVGIKKAKGEYLMFVDSDDYWEQSKSLSSIEQNILSYPNVDVIFFGHRNYNTINKKVSVISQYNDENRKYIESNGKANVIEYLFKNKIFPTAVWRTVVRRETIVLNNLRFVEGLIAEDVDWQISLFLVSNKFSCISDLFYTYSMGREDSISNSSGKNGVKSILYILDKWVPKFEGNTDKISKLFLSYLSFHYSVVFLTYAYLEKYDKGLFRNELISYMRLFDNLSSFRTRLVYYILKVFGVDKGSVVIRSLYKLYLRQK